jgi:hypothetical protein
MDVLFSGLWSLDRRTPVYLAGTARLESFQSDKFKVAPPPEIAIPGKRGFSGGVTSRVCAPSTYALPDAG